MKSFRMASAGAAILLCAVCGVLAEEPIAFPGAEGFGRYARGGRGGDVYHVTTLEDDGPGSLREGILSATGPRTIVFEVSGTIELRRPLVAQTSFLTIAGQTAPGEGISISNQTFLLKNAEHIILRYVRFRTTDGHNRRVSSPDALQMTDVNHVILDHVSMSWGIENSYDVRRGGNFTLQWSIYAEPTLRDNLHEKGTHSLLVSFRDLTGSVSMHHNLFASSRDRQPTLAGSPKSQPDALVDFRNNVVYNVSGATNLGNCPVNVVNNYFLPGLNSAASGRPLTVRMESQQSHRVFLSGNNFVAHPEWTRKNAEAIDLTRWNRGNFRPASMSSIHLAKELDIGAQAVSTDPAEVAYERVLQRAGAAPRDRMDAQMIQQVRSRTHRMFSTPPAEGKPTLKSQPSRRDTDRDGMPDDWERQYGLNPREPADRNWDRDKDGFTNLEEYLNSLCFDKSGS